MVYTWVFRTDEDEADALKLPVEAQNAMRATLDAVIFDPWNFQRTPSEPEGKALRILSFGGGRGEVTIVILEHQRLVVVVQYHWLDLD